MRQGAVFVDAGFLLAVVGTQVAGTSQLGDVGEAAVGKCVCHEAPGVDSGAERLALR
jgi:hypothetical protein